MEEEAGRKCRPSKADRTGAGEAGFSLIEALIAAAVLAMLLVSILPLFTSSLASTQTGAESTRVGTWAKSELETLYQLPFENQELALPNGATSATFEEYWPLGGQEWVKGSAPAGVAVQWRRKTTVQQFAVSDLSTPLPGGTDPASVHLKQIDVVVEGERKAGPLGAGRRLRLRVLKPF